MSFQTSVGSIKPCRQIWATKWGVWRRTSASSRMNLVWIHKCMLINKDSYSLKSNVLLLLLCMCLSSMPGGADKREETAWASGPRKRRQHSWSATQTEKHRNRLWKDFTCESELKCLQQIITNIILHAYTGVIDSFLAHFLCRLLKINWINQQLEGGSAPA